MNRSFWQNRSFTNENPVNYQCPKCFVGFLELKNILLEITQNGINLEKHNYPYGIEHIFSGILICKNNSCKELVSVNGECLKDIHSAEELYSGELVEKYFSVYNPKYFYPNLKTFNIGSEVPVEISEQVNLSFSHFFNDLASCGNRIRNSIELILNDLNAPKKAKNKKGKIYKFTNLHQRIEHFTKSQKRLGQLLLAIKIIGNEGSHIGDIKIDDILDAYEILEEIVEIVYIKKRNKITTIAKEIVEKNKPRTK